jgi:exopolysaccharide production protein ExoZ
MRAGGGTIASVQILRAVAAIAVVFVHIGLDLNYWVRTNTLWVEICSVGVDLFFVISGFIMTLISWDQFGQARAPLDFMRRRLIRILPIYWLLTTVFVLGGHYETWRILESYFLYRSGEPHLIKVAWTLDYELAFYAVFALGLTLPRMLGLPAIAGIIIANVWLGFSPPAYSDPLVIEFVLGMAAAIVYRKGVRIPAAAAIALISIGVLAIALLQIPQPHDPLRWGIPVLLILLGAVLCGELPDNAVVRGACAVGNASYVLYLAHWPIVRALCNLARHTGLNFAGSVLLQIAAFVCITAVTIGIALLLYRYVEAPMTQALQRLLDRPRRSPISSTPMDGSVAREARIA